MSRMLNKKCHLCKQAKWTCRGCGRKTCEHYCSNKTGDGMATCGACHLRNSRFKT